MGKLKYKLKKKEVDEASTTGGSATFTPGTGGQYATPYAFSKKGKYKDGGVYTKTYGYKLVPKKIKGSGLEVKQLFESEVSEYQEGRIAQFDRIEQEMNDIYKTLNNLKDQTIDYYNDNPSSTEPVYPTEVVLSYIESIKEILNKE